MISLFGFVIFRKEEFQREINSRVRTALNEFVHRMLNSPNGIRTEEDIDKLILQITNKRRVIRNKNNEKANG